VVAEANVRYRASARFDDELDLVAELTRLGTTSTVTSVRAERIADGTVLAEGDLRHVFLNVRTHQKTEIPDGVRAELARFAA
jgi:acyl-CoA thioester hydrolase